MYQSLTSIRRILCLYVPRFAAVASGAGEGEPRALIEQQRQMMIVHSVNQTAERLGVTPGMALSDARAFAQGLTTATLDPHFVQTAAVRLAQWLGRYSPLVGHNPENSPQKIGGGIGFWIDISGVAHLFGGEARLMQDLSKRLKDMGLPDAQLAIAPTPGAAWAMAHYSGNATSSIQPSDTRSALYPLSPAALRLHDKTLEALDRLGLRRIADLVRLPRAEVGQRFPRDCKSLLLRLDQAFGDVAESVDPIAPPAPYACRQLYPEPVQHKDAVVTGLTDGLQRVLSALERDQRGARQVHLRLFRVDGHCMLVTVKTNAPTRDPKTLLRLFDDKLDALDVGFGLDALLVEVPHHEVLAYAQTSLLLQSGKGHNNTAFDRIANRLGDHAVAQLLVEPSHTPGNDVLRLPLGAKNSKETSSWHRAHRDRSLVGLDQDAPAADQGRAATRQGKRRKQTHSTADAAPGLPITSPRPLHLFARPEPVSFHRSGQHRARMMWRRIHHDLIDLQGPERITADWWKTHIATDPERCHPRDYYQATDADGRRFCLFETLNADHVSTGQWHVAGLM